MFPSFTRENTQGPGGGMDGGPPPISSKAVLASSKRVKPSVRNRGEQRLCGRKQLAPESMQRAYRYSGATEGVERPFGL